MSISTSTIARLFPGSSGYKSIGRTSARYTCPALFLAKTFSLVVRHVRHRSWACRFHFSRFPTKCTCRGSSPPARCQVGISAHALCMDDNHGRHRAWTIPVARMACDGIVAPSGPPRYPSRRRLCALRRAALNGNGQIVADAGRVTSEPVMRPAHIVLACRVPHLLHPTVGEFWAPGIFSSGYAHHEITTTDSRHAH